MCFPGEVRYVFKSKDNAGVLYGMLSLMHE